VYPPFFFPFPMDLGMKNKTLLFFFPWGCLIRLQRASAQPFSFPLPLTPAEGSRDARTAFPPFAAGETMLAKQSVSSPSFLPLMRNDSPYGEIAQDVLPPFPPVRTDLKCQSPTPFSARQMTLYIGRVIYFLQRAKASRGPIFLLSPFSLHSARVAY